MLCAKRNLRAEAKVHGVAWLDRGRLVVQDTDVGVTESLCHDDPHSLTSDDELSLIVCFDIEDEPRRLTSPKRLPSLTRWDPEGLWVDPMRVLR
jgi:hypothetical protein